MSEPLFAYDAVAYPTAIVPVLTPERIAAAGVLHGWRGPDPATSSVLEIGGGDGLNALGIAAAQPGSRVVSFDLAAQPIERGRALARAAGLANVELHQGDILTWPRDGARYDYIVCHGVYAWVPPHVQAGLMDLIGATLAPGGVAYISYDCLPAASAKIQLNAFLTARLSHIEDSETRVALALELLGILAANQRPDSRLKTQIDRFLRDLPNADPHYVFHDLLAENYVPVSLEGFAAAAGRAGLAVVGDAGFHDLFAGDVDEGARSLLGPLAGDMVAAGAMLDMLRGTNMFRRTLLCRADAPPPAAGGDALRALRFETQARRDEVEEDGRRILRYAKNDDSWLIPRAPHEAALMEALLEAAPGELSFDDLAAASGAPDTGALVGSLRKVCAFDLVCAHATPQPFVAMPGDWPRAGELIRAMVAEGDGAVTLRHTRLEAEDQGSRMFISLCDGTRDRAQLAAAMAERLGGEPDIAKVDSAIDRLRRARVFVA